MNMISTITSRLERTAKSLEVKSRLLSTPEWMNRYLRHYLSAPSGRHHEDISRNLEAFFINRGLKKAFIAPRGSAKSTYNSLYLPLRCIVEGREKYILLLAETQPMAKKYLRNLQEELEKNEALDADYPDACGEGPVWAKESCVTKNGVRIEAFGAGQNIRGGRSRQDRPTLIIIDDPDELEAKYSHIIRERNWEWMVKDVLPAGSPTTNFVASGTRIHKKCCISLLGASPGWKSYEYKSILQYPHRMDLWSEWEDILLRSDNPNRQEDADAFYRKNERLMTAGAAVLWEGFHGLKYLMEKRAEMGHASFESEYQNNPIDPASCEWPPELFESCWTDHFPLDAEVKTMYMDPSKGASDKPGDFCAIVRVAKYGELYYVDADMHVRDTSDCHDAYTRRAREWNPDIHGIESYMFQKLFLEMIAKDALGTGDFSPPVPLEDKTKKEIRIRRLGPWLRSKAFRFMNNTGTRILVDQLTEFPSGSHDDGPDALEGAMRLLVSFVRAKTSEEEARQSRYAEV